MSQLDNPKPNITELFNSMIWKPDRMLFKDLVFRLEPTEATDWDLGDKCFRFYKTRELVAQYQNFFENQPRFQPNNLFEIGTYDGGSTIFWNNLFHPNKHISIDLADRIDSPYFQEYRKIYGITNELKTYWGIDQGEKTVLRNLVLSEFNSSIDLVVDDASHMYHPTRSSFEVLFPFCSIGGLYIIEDWAWGHWPDFYSIDHPWRSQVPLTKLVNQCIEVAGTSTALISKITIYYGFVVIERGPLEIKDQVEFDLDNYIKRHPLLPTK